MKIKVEVDLDGFYSEDPDMDFQEQIKLAIAQDVKQQVLSDWRGRVSDEFSGEIKREIDAMKSEFIKKTVLDLFESKTIKARYSNEQITLVAYVEEQMDRDLSVSNYFNSTLTDITKKSAMEISKTLKDRYDLMFASSLVSKMNELGMLKPDVAQMILGKE